MACYRLQSSREASEASLYGCRGKERIAQLIWLTTQDRFLQLCTGGRKKLHPQLLDFGVGCSWTPASETQLWLCCGADESSNHVLPVSGA